MISGVNILRNKKRLVDCDRRTVEGLQGSKESLESSRASLGALESGPALGNNCSPWRPFVRQKKISFFFFFFFFFFFCFFFQIAHKTKRKKNVSFGFPLNDHRIPFLRFPCEPCGKTKGQPQHADQKKNSVKTTAKPSKSWSNPIQLGANLEKVGTP